jgi:hypothetical protein
MHQGRAEEKQIFLQAWRMLLPGAAQVWYRLFLYWIVFWPQRLLQLLLPLPLDELEAIALELLTANFCCIGYGLAYDIRAIADQFPDMRDRVRFILGAWVRSVIQRWATQMHITIADLANAILFAITVISY